MEELSIREAEVGDASGVYEVMQEVGYAKFLGGDTPEEKKKSVIAQFIANKPVRIFVATLPGVGTERIIGYSIIAPAWLCNLSLPERFSRDGYAYSKGVGVFKEFQRKGVGLALAIHTAQQAKSEGYNGMYTDAGTNNPASIAFQGDLGLHELARVPDPKRAAGIFSVLFLIEF